MSYLVCSDIFTSNDLSYLVYLRLTNLNIYPSGGNVYTWGWGGSHGTFSVDGHSSGGQLVGSLIFQIKLLCFYGLPNDVSEINIRT